VLWEYLFWVIVNTVDRYAVFAPLPGTQEMAHFVGLILKSSKICLRNGELDKKEYAHSDIKRKSSAVLEGAVNR
jgi:hypothetical protein